MSLIAQVAMGSSGKIYKASWRQLSEPVAVKVLSIENAYLQTEFEREIAVLTSVHHPTLARVLLPSRSVLWCLPDKN